MKTETIKWIISGLVGAIGLLSGFVWANSKDVSGLNKDMATQTKANDIQYGKIEKNTDKLNNFKGDIQENKSRLIYIKESVDKIEKGVDLMLKEFYSRQK